jgi:hypothetical protein
MRNHILAIEPLYGSNSPMLTIFQFHEERGGHPSGTAADHHDINHLFFHCHREYTNLRIWLRQKSVSSAPKRRPI